DGTGAPPFRGDVGLRGERIGAVGNLTSAESAQRMSCLGRYVMPGFIDAHSHVDALVFDPQVQLAALAQGVKTCIVGQDGLSLGPGSGAATRYAEDYFGAVNGSWPGSPPITVTQLLSSYDR